MLEIELSSVEDTHMAAPAQTPPGHGSTPDDTAPTTGASHLLALLRDDIAATTHPDDPVPLSSRLVCDLITEIIRLRAIATTHQNSDATSSRPSNMDTRSPLG